MRSTSITILAVLTGYLDFSSSQSIEECSATQIPGYDYEIIPEPGFEIRWAVDTDAGTITFEVFNSNESWTAVGFSEDGGMVPGDAIIGLPDEGSVEEYELSGQDSSGVNAFEVQELSDTSVTQGAGTTVVFTRPLAPSTEGKLTISDTPGNTTWVIWAHGESNDLAYHGETRGALFLDLFCGDTTVSSMTPAPFVDGLRVSPTPTAATLAPTDAARGADATPPPTLFEGDTASPSVSPSTTLSETFSPSTVASDVPAPSPSDQDGVDSTESPAAEDDGEEQADGASRMKGGRPWMAAASVAAVVVGSAMFLAW